MNKILTLTFVIFATIVYNTNLWAQQFCATVNDGSNGSGIIQDSNGNYIISGISTGNYKNVLIKIDENANLEWIKKYSFTPATQYESSIDLILTKAGDFVGVGVADGLQIFKTDSLGNMKWARRFTQVNEVSNVLELKDESLIVTGHQTNDIIIIKLDVNGNIIWSKLNGIPFYTDYTHSSVLENDSLQFSLISSDSAGSVITTYDSSGYMINETYIGPQGFYHQLINTSDGGKAFCYYDLYDKIFFGKLSANNTIEWIRTTNYSQISIWVGLFMSMAENNKGELIIGFYEDQSGSGPCILTLDLAGNFISAYYIDNYIVKLINTHDGGIIGLGRNYTTGNIQVSKIDNQMNTCCALSSVTVSLTNYVMANINVTKTVTSVTLNSQSVSATSTNLTGYTLDCFVPGVIGIEEIHSEGFSVYPNPANDILIIHSEKEIGDIKIYDVVGKLIYQELNKDHKDAVIDIKGLNAGMYFIKLNDTKLKFIKQ